jgi:hypothetical protein
MCGAAAELIMTLQAGSRRFEPVTAHRETTWKIWLLSQRVETRDTVTFQSGHHDWASNARSTRSCRRPRRDIGGPRARRTDNDLARVRGTRSYAICGPCQLAGPTAGPERRFAGTGEHLAQSIRAHDDRIIEMDALTKELVRSLSPHATVK